MGNLDEQAAVLCEIQDVEGTMVVGKKKSNQRFQDFLRAIRESESMITNDVGDIGPSSVGTSDDIQGQIAEQITRITYDMENSKYTGAMSDMFDGVQNNFNQFFGQFAQTNDQLRRMCGVPE